MNIFILGFLFGIIFTVYIKNIKKIFKDILSQKDISTLWQDTFSIYSK